MMDGHFMTNRAKQLRRIALFFAALLGIGVSSGGGNAEPPSPLAERIAAPNSRTASTTDGTAGSPTDSTTGNTAGTNSPNRTNNVANSKLGKKELAKHAELYDLDLTAPDHAPIKQPLDPAAAKAFDVLENHCARCHQAGELSPGAKPSGDFGNVLHLQDLARDRHFVQPGNPDGSPLYTSMLKRDMPYDVLHKFEPRARPSVDEIGAVRDWIEGLRRSQLQSAGAEDTGNARPPILRSPSCVEPGGLAGATGAETAATPPSKAPTKTSMTVSVVAKINAYLERAGHKAPKDLRFVSLSHLQRACNSKQEMAVYRRAVVKLLNLISRARQPRKFKSIDAAGTIIAFRLSDLGWSKQQWQQITARDPYRTGAQSPVKPVGADGTAAPMAERAASSRYVRGDWLAYAALRAPLYQELLGQANTAGALRKALHFSLETNIRSVLAKRIAIQGSATAKNNRLLERHEIDNGVYWTSYDFSSNKGRQSLASHPLGPLGKRAFRHKLNAVLYSLPNGFPAFYLNDDEGRRLVEAPRRILRDNGAGRGTGGTISAASTCLSCHSDGPIKISPTATPLVLKTKRLNQAEQTAIEELYVDLDDMNETIVDDAKSMRAAFKHAGLQQYSKLHGVESISALMERYRRPVDLETAALELRTRPEELSKSLVKRSQKFFGLERRLRQGGVAREEFAALFGAVSAVVAKSPRLDGATPGAQVGGVAEGLSEGLAAPPQKGKHKTRKLAFSLSLYSNKSVYKRNDSAQFWASTTRDCNLTLINIDTLGRGTVIFPNDFRPDNKLKAGQLLKLPGDGAPYQFRLREIGSERIVGVCNVGTKSADGIMHNFEKQKFSNLGNYRAFLDKALAKEWTGYAIAAPVRKRKRRRRRRRKTPPKPKPTSVKNKLPLVQARSAIMFDIR